MRRAGLSPELLVSFDDAVDNYSSKWSIITSVYHAGVHSWKDSVGCRSTIPIKDPKMWLSAHENICCQIHSSRLNCIWLQKKLSRSFMHRSPDTISPGHSNLETYMAIVPSQSFVDCSHASIVERHVQCELSPMYLTISGSSRLQSSMEFGSRN